MPRRLAVALAVVACNSPDASGTPPGTNPPPPGGSCPAEFSGAVRASMVLTGDSLRPITALAVGPEDAVVIAGTNAGFWQLGSRTFTGVEPVGWTARLDLGADQVDWATPHGG